MSATRPDVLIVGAGPAGLAAATACLDLGVKITLVERGPEVATRDRFSPEDIVAGVGGAGLFSDGKFSFHPSATKLWRLRPIRLLREAYDWCGGVLSSHSLVAPPFPDAEPIDSKSVLSETFSLKSYSSFYMPLDARTALINRLSERCSPSLQSRTAVRAISLHPLSVSATDETNSLEMRFTPRALIIASGRLGPLLLQQGLGESLMTFRRLEVGVRIEQEASTFFLRDSGLLDPKLVGRAAAGHEWRTFCCCRNGEVVETLADGVASVSGRADGPSTMRSNVGFHVRLLDPPKGKAVWSDLYARLKSDPSPVSEPLEEFLHVVRSGSSALAAILGPELSLALVEGIEALGATVGPDRLRGARLHGPAVEGVATYPDVSHEDLRLPGTNAWVAGDATGLFRGITAALVSGYFAGRLAAVATRGTR